MGLTWIFLSTSCNDQVLYLRKPSQYHLLVYRLVTNCLVLKLEQRYREACFPFLTNHPILCSAQHGVNEVSGTSGVKMFGPCSMWDPAIGMRILFMEVLMASIPRRVLVLSCHSGSLSNGWFLPTNCGLEWQNITIIIVRHPRRRWTVSPYLPMSSTPRSAGQTVSMIIWKSRPAELWRNTCHVRVFQGAYPTDHWYHQWMLNSAWPSLYWQLYDFYGVPLHGLLFCVGKPPTNRCSWFMTMLADVSMRWTRVLWPPGWWQKWICTISTHPDPTWWYVADCRPIHQCEGFWCERCSWFHFSFWNFPMRIIDWSLRWILPDKSERRYELEKSRGITQIL